MAMCDTVLNVQTPMQDASGLEVDATNNFFKPFLTTILFLRLVSKVYAVRGTGRI